jgi:hypothetical protein
MTIDANAIFEDELTRRGIGFVKDGEDEYSIVVEGWNVSASLTNVRRNAVRENDPDAIRRFIDLIMGTIQPGALEWSSAAPLLILSAEPADQDFGDTVQSAITDEVSRVLTLTDEGRTKITWVTPGMCRKWGVTPEAAVATAIANQDRLLDGIELETTEVHGSRLGMIPLDSPYKASVIFAPSFRQSVEPWLGWPVLVVIPCRDFIYVVADNSPLISDVGSVVVNEFKTSGYPITTEVLRISDEGIEAIGSFLT